jgi:hypothetical protein
LVEDNFAPIEGWIPNKAADPFLVDEGTASHRIAAWRWMLSTLRLALSPLLSGAAPAAAATCMPAGQPRGPEITLDA